MLKNLSMEIRIVLAKYVQNSNLKEHKLKVIRSFTWKIGTWSESIVQWCDKCIDTYLSTRRKIFAAYSVLQKENLKQSFIQDEQKHKDKSSWILLIKEYHVFRPVLICLDNRCSVITEYKHVCRKGQEGSNFLLSPIAPSGIWFL